MDKNEWFPTIRTPIRCVLIFNLKKNSLCYSWSSSHQLSDGSRVWIVKCYTSFDSWPIHSKMPSGTRHQLIWDPNFRSLQFKRLRLRAHNRNIERFNQQFRVHCWRKRSRAIKIAYLARDTCRLHIRNSRNIIVFGIYYNFQCIYSVGRKHLNELLLNGKHCNFLYAFIQIKPKQNKTHNYVCESSSK